jgi:hypothetical protein
MADPASAWLRIWTETLLLAFLTNRPLPAVPAPLHTRWSGLEPRLRECALATLIDRAVTARAASIRASYDPLRLAASACAAALRLLDGEGPPGDRTGPNWVIPQLRWLHEAERVCPLAGPPSDPLDRAAPLDFDLVGAADWPDMRAGHRIHALRRHPLSMELESNRLIAWNLLLGADDHRGYSGDLATVTVGRDPGTRLGYAAAEMAVSGWLAVVLSWPRRFIAGELAESFAAEAGPPR